MNIYEATKLALETDGYIVSDKFPSLAIKPTNTPGGCLVQLKGEARIGKRWQPHAEDLVSENWQVIRTIDELPLRTHSPS